MTDYLSADQMRALEREAIESGKVTGLGLMERAGKGVLAAIIEHWPLFSQAARALVLCGPGNNGGDGFVVARLLHGMGWDVDVLFYGTQDGLPDDAKTNLDAWIARAPTHVKEIGFPVMHSVTPVLQDALSGRESEPRLVIDALFGIGLKRPVSALSPVFEALEKSKKRRSKTVQSYHVSIDLPSGLSENGPIGSQEHRLFRPDLTVTFHRPKLAHKNGAAYCGVISVKDIGLGDLM